MLSSSNFLLWYTAEAAMHKSRTQHEEHVLFKYGDGDHYGNGNGLAWGHGAGYMFSNGASFSYGSANGGSYGAGRTIYGSCKPTTLF